MQMDFHTKKERKATFGEFIDVLCLHVVNSTIYNVLTLVIIIFILNKVRISDPPTKARSPANSGRERSFEHFTRG